mmetsp:Transcript_39525/g.66256  ORF Transcript_39525/g.66256 Transcript_39525/m.66256 type:complete len:102 (-) Transcript_39525:55-360(-)
MLTVLPGAGQRDNMSTEKNDDEKIATTPRQHGNSLPPPTSPSCPDDSLRGVNITVEGKCYVVQIAVVDLDRKAVAKIPKYCVIEETAIKSLRSYLTGSRST